MTQASFRRHRLLPTIQTLPWPTLKRLSLSAASQRKLRQVLGHLARLDGPGGWVLGATTTLALFLWNWKLLLATAIGLGMMALIHLMQQPIWRQYLARIQSFLKYFTPLYTPGPGRQLFLSVGGGALGIFVTYLAASVWADSESAWVASGALLQGFGTLSVLLVLIWQMIQRQADRVEDNLQKNLQDLTHPDALARLLAVKHLTRSLEHRKLNGEQRAIVADCFRLMLSRESEVVLKDALLDGFKAMERLQPLAIPQTAPATPAVPPAVKQTPRPRKRRK